MAEGRQCIALDSVGSNANVHIRFKNVAEVFREDLAPRLVDFLEIASYVFSADCATQRGKKWADEDRTEPWERDLAFVIPVREPTFWGAARIRSLIEQVLNFLSNDKYSFTFRRLEHDRLDQQQYLNFADIRDWPFHGPERVLMFSGGLDSLAGAVETARAGGKSVLVSHRPVSTLDARQKKLFRELQKKFPGQLIHIPVWINKAETFGREPTQRTRSFLFSALGTLVAQSVHSGGVRFYENGIVSLNLPLAQEALRARASRTTHPVAIHLLSSLCAAVTKSAFVIDNPYLFKTKTEVVANLGAHEAADLIPYTCSCSHSMFQTRTQRHCGRCSQCIDRRFAIAGTGLIGHDPEADYVSDVFVGAREKDMDRAIAVDYARHGIELARRPGNELATIFSAEISRAVRYDAKRNDAAQGIISMHKRHGEVVERVLVQKLKENAERVFDRTLNKTSLLALALGQQYVEHSPRSKIEGGDEVPGNGCSVDPASGVRKILSSDVTRMERKLDAVLAKFEAPRSARNRKKSKLAPSKRDTVIFAAILSELKSTKYCWFLHEHGIKPKWGDSNSTYPQAYHAGNPGRKKIQDEKSRAKKRMSLYADSELADAFNRYLPTKFAELSQLLRSRNSRNASKTFASPNPHKH